MYYPFDKQGFAHDMFKTSITLIVIEILNLIFGGLDHRPLFDKYFNIYAIYTLVGFMTFYFIYPFNV